MSNSSLRCSDVASGDEGTCHPHFILMQNEPQTDRGINIAQCSTLPPTLYPHAEWTTHALLPLLYFSTHNTKAPSHLIRVQSHTHMVVRMTKKPLGNGDYTAFKKGRHQTHGDNSVKSQLFFTIFFTVRFSSKFAAKYLLKIPPHLICIATVYRWCTVVSVKHWIMMNPRLKMSHSGCARVRHCQTRVIIFQCRTNDRASSVLSYDQPLA